MESIDTLPEADSDETLRQRFVSAGDQRAFRQLVGRHAGMVWRTALRRCGDRAEAEEVAQDVFVVLARKAQALRAEEGLGPWLHRVTVILSRKAASLRAGAQRRRDGMRAFVAEASHLSETAGGGEQLERLDEALAGLSPRDRAILWWRYVDGRSLREIAERSGATEAACQKRSERALARLRRRMAGAAAGSAGIGQSLAALTPGEAESSRAGEWARHALKAGDFPAAWKTGWRFPQTRRGAGKGRGLAAAAGLGALLCATLAVGWPRSGEPRGGRVTGARVHPAPAAGGPRAAILPDPKPGGIPVEAALREEWLRRRAVRKELHLALLTERLALTREQRETAAALYERHGLNLRTMLGRQGEIVVEVSSSRDDLTRGSLGPLSGSSPEFEAAFAALLTPSQAEAWDAFRSDLERNAFAMRLEAYLGTWLSGGAKQEEERRAAKEEFAALAARDIENRAGIWRGNSFHSPPFFEFQPTLTEGVLAGGAREAFALASGAPEYADLPATFRARAIHSSVMAERYAGWAESARESPPAPETRAMLEMSRLRAAVLLTSAQAERASEILRAVAAAQPVEEWPLFHPASDAEAAGRRAALVDSLAPALTALQRKVLEDAPLSLPHIGESVSLSSGYDAAAAVW